MAAYNLVLAREHVKLTRLEGQPILISRGSVFLFLMEDIQVKFCSNR